MALWSRKEKPKAARAAGGRTRGIAFDASSVARMLADWHASDSGANTAMLHGLPTMRARCRDLARNNEWIESSINGLVSNITDPGIVPISMATDTAFRDALRARWKEWGEVADAHGVLDWDLLVGLAYRSMIESGEVFARIRPRLSSDGLPVPMQVQVIEADHVPTTKNENLPNGNKILAGIEFDRLGRRVAYHMYPEHPGEMFQGIYNGATVRVPASEVVHLFDPKRPGQVRGYPQLVPALVRIRNLMKYEDAELVKKLVASLMVGVVTSPTPEADMLGDELGPEETGETDMGVNWAKMEPGTFTVLAPGEDVKFSNPPASDSNYEQHAKMNLRAVAAALGITYEQMTGDLGDVNFSSIRAGLNEFQRRARRMQRLLIHQFCRPVMARWIDEAVFAGALLAPDYVTKRADYQRVQWRPPGWSYVNPQQEIAAIKEELKAGLTSRTAVLADKGHDVSTVDEQIAADYERAQAMGLRFDTDPDGVDQRNESVQSVDGAAAPASDTAAGDTVADASRDAGLATLAKMARALDVAEEIEAARNEDAANEVAAIIGGARAE